jgi:hypothetical protein
MHDFALAFGERGPVARVVGRAVQRRFGSGDGAGTTGAVVQGFEEQSGATTNRPDSAARIAASPCRGVVLVQARVRLAFDAVLQRLDIGWR